MKTRLAISCALVALLFAVNADPQTTGVTYRCRKPTTGARPTAFLWYVGVNDSTNITLTATSPDSFATLQIPTRDVAYVRVQARDALGRVGPLSVASLPEVPPAPGACGRPNK